MAGERRSLLEEAGEHLLAGRLPPDPKIIKARQQLEQAMTGFRQGEDRSAKAFGRYCLAVTRIVERSGLPARSHDLWIGAYVKAGSASKRDGGKPRSPEAGFLDMLRHEINRERGATSWEQSVTMRIPRKEIAIRASRDFGLVLSEEQVGKLLAGTGRK